MDLRLRALALNASYVHLQIACSLCVFPLTYPSRWELDDECTIDVSMCICTLWCTTYGELIYFFMAELYMAQWNGIFQQSSADSSEWKLNCDGCRWVTAFWWQYVPIDWYLSSLHCIKCQTIHSMPFDIKWDMGATHTILTEHQLQINGIAIYFLCKSMIFIYFDCIFILFYKKMYVKILSIMWLQSANWLLLKI